MAGANRWILACAAAGSASRATAVRTAVAFSERVAGHASLHRPRNGPRLRAPRLPADGCGRRRPVSGRCRAQAAAAAGHAAATAAYNIRLPRRSACSTRAKAMGRRAVRAGSWRGSTSTRRRSERGPLARGREKAVDERDLGCDLLGRAAHQGIGEPGGPPRPPRGIAALDEARRGHAHEHVEHSRARRERAREPGVLDRDGRQHGGPGARGVRVPPGGGVGRVAQAGEAVAGVVEQQRGELVDVACRRRTPSGPGCARASARAPNSVSYQCTRQCSSTSGARRRGRGARCSTGSAGAVLAGATRAAPVRRPRREVLMAPRARRCRARSACRDRHAGCGRAAGP